MPISMSALAERVMRLEAKLDYYEENLDDQVDPPSEEDLIERVKEKYPGVEADTIGEIDWHNPDMT